MAVGSRLWVKCTAFLLGFHSELFVSILVLILHMIDISCNVKTTWFHNNRVSCSFDSTYVMSILHEPCKTVKVETNTNTWDFGGSKKRIEKIWRGKWRWLTFINQFDNHKSIWALSDKYHSDAKWFGKHNDIIHFCLNLIAMKAFISHRWCTILKSLSVLFFLSRQNVKCWFLL